ncbi:MAG: hypothetical protein RDA78_20445 [Roseibium sp.]|uniref:hypothetical protein n=1 Tax=Roseibium sp. TaxID=1936156 RepID=UPI003D9C3077
MTYSDQELLDFLSGDMDPRRAEQIEQTMRVDRELEHRVMTLDPIAAPVRGAMKGLPGRRVLADLERVVPDGEKRGRNHTQWTKLAAVLVLGAVLGGGAMWLGMPSADDWRGRVAQYQSLYVADTVRLTIASADVLERQLEVASKKLGRPLEQAPLDAPSLLRLARVQVLGLDDAPLIQIVYQDAEGTPFALCVTTAGPRGEASDPSSEMLHGLATTAWEDGSFRYIFVGGDDLEKTGAVASQLKSVL